MVLMPWETVQRFDEGGGFTSLYIGGEFPVDVLLYDGVVVQQGDDPEPIPTEVKAFGHVALPVNYATLPAGAPSVAQYVPPKEPVKTQVWIPPTIDEGYNYNPDLVMEPGEVQHHIEFEEAIDRTVVPEDVGGDEEAGFFGGILGGVNEFVSGGFDRANDAINPFAWFGVDPARTTKKVYTEIGGAPTLIMLVVMMAMMGRD